MIIRIICLMLLSAPLQAQEWGRLFYTPAERAGVSETHSAPTQDAAPAPKTTHRFDGELQTPRGKVRWVNGQKAQPPAGKKPGDVWQE